MGMAMPEILAGLQAGGTTLGIIKQAKDLLPAGPAKTQIEAKIAEAEEQDRLAQAQIAQAMGYTLCKAHWPPVIMLSIGRDPKWNIERFRCSECGALEPTDDRMRMIEEEQAAADRLNYAP